MKEPPDEELPEEERVEGTSPTATEELDDAGAEAPEIGMDGGPPGLSEPLDPAVPGIWPDGGLDTVVGAEVSVAASGCDAVLEI